MNTKEAVDRFRKNVGKPAWSRLMTRLEEFNRDMRRRGMRPAKISVYKEWDLLTGYSYAEFYDWDLYFENIYASYFGISRFCRNNLEAFLDQQLECGYVPRTLINPRQRQHFKPFLAQNALLGCRQTRAWDWLVNKYYDRLKKYLDHWFWYWDLDKNGLCVWDSSDHSGMDNQIRRAGAVYSMAIEGVDLNCYLVRELLAMAVIAGKLGRKEDQREFSGHAEKLERLIHEVLWDDKDGFYYDRNERTGETVRVKSICGFLPMFLGGVPKRRAERLVREHLLNPYEFWLKYPIATWAKDEPDYYQENVRTECNWRGPAWVPTNYMVFHGLLKQGYRDLAKELAYRTFDMVLAEADTREYYNAETGAGMGLNPFWGWSGLAYFMPLEYEMDYDPSDIGREKIVALGTEVMGVQFPA